VPKELVIRIGDFSQAHERTSVFAIRAGWNDKAEPEWGLQIIRGFQGVEKFLLGPETLDFSQFAVKARVPVVKQLAVWKERFGHHFWIIIRKVGYDPVFGAAAGLWFHQDEPESRMVALYLESKISRRGLSRRGLRSRGTCAPRSTCASHFDRLYSVGRLV